MLAVVVCFPIDSLNQFTPQGGWSDQQSLVGFLARIPCEGIEEIGDISPDHGVTGEIAQDGVDAARYDVIVSSAEMDIAPESIRIAPDDETELRVGLKPAHPVDDVHAFIFELASPFDVVFFIKAGFELDEDCHLLPVDTGFHQRVHNGRPWIDAIERL